MSQDHPKTVVRIAAGIALIAAPVMQLVGFALHPTFWTFAKESDAAIQLRTILDWTMPWTLGHALTMVSLPVWLFALAYLATLIREVRPWHSIVGLALGGVGAVFMGGVFGVALAQGALATVPPNDGSVPILQAIMDNRGAMFLLYLSALLPIATLIVGAGLYTSRVVPRWASGLYLIGNLIVIAFMDRDALMFAGTALVLAGSLPIARAAFRSGPAGEISRAGRASAGAGASH